MGPTAWRRERGSWLLRRQRVGRGLLPRDRAGPPNDVAGNGGHAGDDLSVRPGSLDAATASGKLTTSLSSRPGLPLQGHLCPCARLTSTRGRSPGMRIVFSAPSSDPPGSGQAAAPRHGPGGSSGQTPRVGPPPAQQLREGRALFRVPDSQRNVAATQTSDATEADGTSGQARAAKSGGEASGGPDRPEQEAQPGGPMPEGAAAVSTKYTASVTRVAQAAPMKP